MRSLSFRSKLLLATMLVVAAVTGLTLFATQRNVEATHQRMLRERFRREVDLFSAVQDARLGAVKSKGLAFARSVRLIAAIGEKDSELLYTIALDELRDVLSAQTGGQRSLRATFFRFVDKDWEVLSPPDQRAGLLAAAGHERWEKQLANVARALHDAEPQSVGYLAPRIGGRPELQEVVVTRIVDPVGERTLGALAIGFPAQRSEEVHEPVGQIQSGIWLDGRLYSQSIPEPMQTALAVEMASALARGERQDGELTVDADGIPHRMLYRASTSGTGFPATFQIALYSMAEPLAQQQALQRRILMFGGVALLLGLALSLLISHGLSVPIRELVAGTGEIQRGNLNVEVPVRSRDEIGRLAASFNEMAAGLALKEKYRSILDLVADKEVARQLLRGEVALGGETKEVSVLFCDIRGFTGLTQDMEPTEVIQLLNEHMTALTRVVHDNRGVVDKFVGDSLMAIFGAPQSGGNDAFNAVQSAQRMVEERMRLNRTSRYQIEIGIGIASGTVVAGCMGSDDRLNYTVLGGRVNLASRLCAQAGRMQVLIDETTRQRLADLVGVEALPEMKLKGFTLPVAAFRLTEIGSVATAS